MKPKIEAPSSVNRESGALLPSSSKKDAAEASVVVEEGDERRAPVRMMEMHARSPVGGHHRQSAMPRIRRGNGHHSAVRSAERGQNER